jgi:MYXO-CTERM domain-containing protein
MNKKAHVLALALGLAGATPIASAQIYAFDCITNTSTGNCAAGEAQLNVALSSSSGTQALFTFTNSGPAASSITDVYFDDGTLLGIAAVFNSSGVDFSQGAAPPNLPGGNTIGFNTTAGFNADSNPPTQPNGVNPGETLGILFNLQAGRTFSDVISDLASGALRIGVHVQGFGNGGSESFVNLAQPVPEASTLTYLAAGLGVLGLAGALRRRQR